jgi:signal transduction histidine kinase
MAAFPILLASFHGHLYHVTLKNPVGALPCMLSPLSALVFIHSPSHLAILAVAAPMAVGCAFILGSFATQDHRTRLQNEALKAAIDAQLLQERSDAIDRISSTVFQLRGTNHDAGNALSGLLIQLQQFVMLARADNFDKETLKDAQEIAKDVSDSFYRLKDLISTARDIGAKSAPVIESVDVSAVINEVIDELSGRFTKVMFNVNVVGPQAQFQWPMRGGRLSLYRAVTNVVLNGCQGNGKKAASRVDIIVRIDEQHWCHIDVLDDGPGFTPGQLSDVHLSLGYGRLETTKADGTGLGLFTTQRILSAGNAKLTVGNRADTNGAKVTLSLPTAASHQLEKRTPSIQDQTMGPKT